MPIYRLDGLVPEIHPQAYVAAEATVTAAVRLASGVSVWPGAVLRADNEPITVGHCSNIQEGAVLHTDPGSPLTIGENVTVGHQAMLHGCRVGDGSLIGIQAVVLNNAVIGKNCLVAAGSVIPEGKVFPDRSLIMGVPAKVVRQLDDAAVAGLLESAAGYARRAVRFKEELAAVPPA